MDNDIALKTVSLSKKYKGTAKFALNDLNISINKGEVYGFLGPNGAGKSTTIRLIMNFLQPTSGEMYLGGRLVGSSSGIYQNVGYLSGDFVAYPKLTGQEFLEYMSVFSSVDTKSTIKQLSEQLEIDLSKRIGSLSTGNRQKIGIIQAFMNQPDILILDEPTSGLDPLKQEVFYDLIANAKNRGCCVFISSHNLSEVQKMCDRVAIIRDGSLVHESTISDLELEASQTFEITFEKKVPISELKKVIGIKNLRHSGNVATLHIHGEITPLLKVLANHNVLKLSSQELDLESEFMRYYEIGVKK